MPTLALEQVSFKYKHGIVPALRRVHLAIQPGEAVGIVGPNGSGKTTLCLLLNGLIPHAVRGTMEGRVLVEGIDTATRPVHATARDVGIVLQNPEAQFFGETVEEELAFAPENFQLPAPEIARRIAASLASVGLSGFEERFPFHLSGGQKQRVAVGIALAMEPGILVMDEPTSELDPKGKAEVLDAIATLATGHGQTVVISSHETDELIQIVQRVIALAPDGAVAADGSPHEVLGGALPAEIGIRQPQLYELWRGLGEVPPTSVSEAASRLRSSFHPIAFAAPPPRSARPPVITCRDLSYVYPNGICALRGIDLNIQAGEFVAIMGRNGSGKTTLTKHLNGLLTATSGTLSVAGEDPARSGTASMARTVGYVFQNPDHQIFSQTVGDEFAFGLRNIGVPDNEIGARTQEALERAGLELSAGTYPHFLGKGDRQRLALATVLAMRPDILVIDEPTTGLDWRNAQATMQTLERLNASGLTILFVTHDSRLVAEHAGRVVVMADGLVVADGDPATVFYNRDVMERSAIRPPVVMQLAAALADDPGTLRIRSVCDMRRCLTVIPEEQAGAI